MRTFKIFTTKNIHENLHSYYDYDTYNMNVIFSTNEIIQTNIPTGYGLKLYFILTRRLS